MIKFLANLLPLFIKKPLYMLKHGWKVYTSEPVAGVFMDLGIRKTDELWRGRLAEGHELGICKWFTNNLSGKDVFFDIGAHYGFFLSLATAIDPRINIHAFEPGWQQGLYLKRNAFRNNPANRWHIIEKMVGDKDTHNMISLDTYSKQNNVIPSVIQCDVDGSEIYVVRGAAGLIKQRETTFLIELHPHLLKKENASTHDILEFFKEGYDIKVLPNIREDSVDWLDDQSLLHDSCNPYMLATPLPN